MVWDDHLQYSLLQSGESLIALVIRMPGSKVWDITIFPRHGISKEDRQNLGSHKTQNESKSIVDKWIVDNPDYITDLLNKKRFIKAEIFDKRIKRLML